MVGGCDLSSSVDRMARDGLRREHPQILRGGREGAGCGQARLLKQPARLQRSRAQGWETPITGGVQRLHNRNFPVEVQAARSAPPPARETVVEWVQPKQPVVPG